MVLCNSQATGTPVPLRSGRVRAYRFDDLERKLGIAARSHLEREGRGSCEGRKTGRSFFRTKTKSGRREGGKWRKLEELKTRTRAKAR